MALILPLMCKERGQDLAERVEPGIDSRGELLMTGCGQVHLQRRLLHKTLEAPVESNECAGRFQALDAPSQLSHTPPCCTQDPWTKA